MGGDHRRLHAMDRISGLPDELLHSILVRLRSARAAARTSLLSHRWRRLRGRKSFVNDETTKLPRCETLRILWTSYGRHDDCFTPTMLHILRKCNGIKKCKVIFRHSGYFSRGRPSRSLETSDITLDLLEEVEIEWNSETRIKEHGDYLALLLIHLKR
ncbi:hypothetical protein EJB05_11873, partial [Eragrostis curvula]